MQYERNGKKKLLENITRDAPLGPSSVSLKRGYCKGPGKHGREHSLGRSCQSQTKMFWFCVTDQAILTAATDHNEANLKDVTVFI